MSDTVEKRSYKMLDAWRGFASLWVVFFHATGPLLDQFPWMRSHPVYILASKGDRGVWMFFVISGYCIINAALKSLKRENGLKDFIKARMSRIYPPYWFSLLASLAMTLLAAWLASRGLLRNSHLADKNVLQQGISYYLSNVLLAQVVLHQPFLLDVVWTLCYEVAFYALVAVGLACAKGRQAERFLLNACHIVTIFSLLLLILVPGHVFYPLDFWPMFGLGIVMYEAMLSFQQWRIRLTLLLTGMLILLLSVFYEDGIGFHGLAGRNSFLFGLAFALLLPALARYDARLSRQKVVGFFAWLGQFSYSLYLTHILVVTLVAKIFERTHRIEKWHFAYVLTAATLSVAAARLFYQFCERPFIRAASKPIPAVSVAPGVVK